ncbi:MAG TPA: winged helix-turn-helix domain-containing protein [Chitinophagaceae bacterium]|nr:winged helix-turn-helix domain-containing protein [Chitinophagaceae bacterium]
METHFKEIAALIGDPTRATILWTLLDGRAFTATELALSAETSPQNISMHLNKLVQSNLLSVESQGRHRYYRFSRKEIAYGIEAIANLIPPHGNYTTVENQSPIKYCRTCYDHLAGKVGVAFADSLLHKKFIAPSKTGFELSRKGEKWFLDFGIPVEELKQQRRSFLRPCLDWSERRDHIAGSLAASILEKMLLDDWLRKIKHSRAVVITAKGKKCFQDYFGISA